MILTVQISLRFFSSLRNQAAESRHLQ